MRARGSLLGRVYLVYCYSWKLRLRLYRRCIMDGYWRTTRYTYVECL